MIRLYLLLATFFSTLFLAACSEEPYRIEDSVCGKFLQNNPDIVKDYQYISCFDSTHVVYQLNYLDKMAFLAEIQENRIRTRQKIVYDKDPGEVVFTDLDTIKSNALKEISESVDRTDSIDTSYSYKPLKKILMETEELNDLEFEKKFKSADTLYAIMNRLESSTYFSRRFSIARKNDSTFYAVDGRWEYPNSVSLFSRDGKKIKELFIYQLVTSCHENPPVFFMKPQGTDSTFFLEFSYVREEEYIRDKENHKTYKGYVSLDLKNDSLSYGSEDSLTIFHIAHYKENGDTVISQPEFKEADLERTKRRKCIGHFF